MISRALPSWLTLPRTGCRPDNKLHGYQKRPRVRSLTFYADIKPCFGGSSFAETDEEQDQAYAHSGFGSGLYIHNYCGRYIPGSSHCIRYRESIGLLNAIFEATSAVCVTGLVVVDTGKDLSLFGQLVMISLIQIGGLGFMTTATLVFLILGKRITLRERLVIKEALNEYNLQGLVRLARRIILITFAIEGIGALILALKFIPAYGWAKGLYYSIFHAVSAFCNAGFDIIGDYKSFTEYANDLTVNFTLMSLIISGGLGFSVLLDIWRNRCFRKWSLHTKLVVCTTAGLIPLGALFF